MKIYLPTTLREAECDHRRPGLPTPMKSAPSTMMPRGLGRKAGRAPIGSKTASANTPASRTIAVGDQWHPAARARPISSGRTFNFSPNLLLCQTQVTEVMETGKAKIRPKNSQSSLPFKGKGLEFGLHLFWSFQGFSKGTYFGHTGLVPRISESLRF